MNMFQLYSSSNCAHNQISLSSNSPNINNMATCFCVSSFILHGEVFLWEIPCKSKTLCMQNYSLLMTNIGNLMKNIGNLCIQAIKHGVKNKNLRSYSHLPWSSYTTQVFCKHKMQKLPKTIQTISHIDSYHK